MDTAIQYVSLSYAKGVLTNTCRSSLTCKNRCLPGKDCCKEHFWCAICKDRPKVHFGKFCDKHTCKHKECLYKAGQAGLCSSHTCATGGCNLDTLPNSSNCVVHNRCLVKGCNAQKELSLYSYGKACGRHRRELCVEGDCLRRREKDRDNRCEEHYQQRKKRRKMRAEKERRRRGKFREREARAQAKANAQSPEKSKLTNAAPENWAISESAAISNREDEATDGCVVS